MNLYGVARIRSIALWLSAFSALGCGSSSKNASIAITAPEKGQVLTSKDDLNKTRDGLQYSVTASSSEVAAGTDVILQIENQQEAAIAQVGKDGSIVFDAVSLPAGTHTLTVSTMSGGVRSPDDWQYTYRALIIDEPDGSKPIGGLDDENQDKDGIQISVAVSAPGVELSSDVSLHVDGAQVGEPQRPSADGKLVWKGVDLADGDHQLQAFADGLESEIVKVSVSSVCASGSFVMPMPPSGSDPLVLGGGDKCPADGEPFKTDFWFATSAGDNRDVELYVNDVLYRTEKVQASTVKFTEVVLDRYNTPNKVEVVVQSAQGVTCKRIAYPVEIRLDCAGVDCSISGPQPVAGVNANGDNVQYLNASQRKESGFEFEVHTDAESIGKPVKLIIDGRDLDAPTADPSGSDPNVMAKFTGVSLSEGAHTVQALCEHKSGTRGFSRKFDWIVDTQACGVDITKPAADAVITPEADTDSGRSGLQLAVETAVTGDDCNASRADVCDPEDGIGDDVGFMPSNGTNPLKATVTLGDEAKQSVCVEVRDRAGNRGKDSVSVNRRAPKLAIESPANNDKFNSQGEGDYKPDSDAASADVCNADFDVLCTELDADVQLRRGTGQDGTVLATVKCAAKGGSDPALPGGYTGRAHFPNVAFLPNDADSTQVIATQSVSSLVVKSAAISLSGDCTAPKLAFEAGACGPFSVENPSDPVNDKTVVATDTSGDTDSARLLVTKGQTTEMKDAAIADGKYTFTDIDYGTVGASVTLEVIATDDAGNVGKVSCKVGVAYGTGITDVVLPDDPRKGQVKLSWAPPPTAGGYTGYELRCDTKPLDIATTTSAGDQNAWWTGARVVALPMGLAPPATTADVSLRIGENAHCMIRGKGPGASDLSPIVSTTNVHLQFRTQNFSPIDDAAYKIPNPETMVETAGQRAGYDFAPVGDVNGDGIDDLLVGGRGIAYLVFGSREWTTSTPSVRFLGKVNTTFGNVVVGLGDFNGDDLNDFAIADRAWPQASGTGTGRVLVYFGRNTNNWPQQVDTRTTCNADLCFEDSATHYFGISVASAGDFDGDGTRDIAIGAPRYPVTTSTVPPQSILVGRLYVLLGGDLTAGQSRKASGFYELSVPVQGATTPRGFTVSGAEGETGLLGQSVASLGNYDEATGDDLVVSALGSESPAIPAKVYLVAGRTYSGSGLVDVAVNTATLIASGQANYFGTSVTALGNVYDVADDAPKKTIDIAVTEANRNYYYIFPGDNGFDSDDRITVSAVPGSGVEGMWLGGSICNGSGDRGDLDNDGYAELCSGSALDPTPVLPAKPAAPGVVDLWYGGDALKSKVVSRTVTTASASVLAGPPNAGSLEYKVVEYIGDLNGDGEPDIAIGNYGADSRKGQFSILY